MADGYPSELLAVAIPSAAKNRAGIKSATMNAISEESAQRPRKAAPPQKKAPPPQKPLPAPGKDAAASIKKQAAMSGIKMGNKPLWMEKEGVPEAEIPDLRPQPADTNFDPFVGDGSEIPDAVMESGPSSAACRAPGRVRPSAVAEPSAADKYLAGKSRITFELPDGQMSMGAVDVRESRYSLLVLIPLREDAMVFVPKMGTKLSVALKDKSVKAVYPGAYVEVPELGVGFMTLIKDE
jgi:hypothetical protein